MEAKARKQLNEVRKQLNERPLSFSFSFSCRLNGLQKSRLVASLGKKGTKRYRLAFRLVQKPAKRALVYSPT
jgi:hypothetical protein